MRFFPNYFGQDLFKNVFYNGVPDDQATGYASQHIWCLSQAGINWEGCVRKGILHKMVGWHRWGHQLVWIVGASACVIFILLQKIQKVAKCTFWYQLTGVVPDKIKRVVKWLCVCVCLMTVPLVCNPAVTLSSHTHCVSLVEPCCANPWLGNVNISTEW